MNLLIAGLGLFIVVHLIPNVPPLRTALVGLLGDMPYRGVFALAALAGLVMIGWGFPDAPAASVYAPLEWGRHIALIAVPVGLVLFVAAYLPTHLRALLRHPMLLGLLLWALAHLVANGELRSVVLFGGLGVYAVVGIVGASKRDKRLTAGGAPKLSMDVTAVVVGLVAAGILIYFHAELFGMPAI